MADMRCKRCGKVLFAAWKLVVCESHVRPDEHIVLDPKTIPQLDTVLDRDAIAHDHIVFNKDLGADVAVATYPRLGQHDDVLPDVGAVADVGRLDICAWVNHRVHCLLFIFMGAGLLRPPVSIHGGGPGRS